MQSTGDSRPVVAGSGDTVVRVSGLRKSYGGNEAVRGVDFTIRRGTIFGLLGPNGTTAPGRTA